MLSRRAEPVKRQMERGMTKRQIRFSKIPAQCPASRRNADVMRGKTLILAAAAMVLPMPVAAQMVDVPIWSNGILGQQALRNTYDNFNEANGLKKGKSRATRECSAESVPAAEQRRIEAGYMRHAEEFGKESAAIWVQEEGLRYRMKLVRQGVCPAPTAREMAAIEEWRAKTSRNR
jgi:hypothetical protein